MSDESYKLQPELSDVLEMVDRYMAVNKHAYFVFAFLGNNNDSGIFNPEKSMCGAYGDLKLIESTLDSLRTMSQEKVEDGFVNF